MQLNTNKSDNATHDFLKSDRGRADILAIQEPYIDSKGRTRALPHLRVIYPTGHVEHFGSPTRPRTRSLIMIHTRIATNNWTQLDIQCADMTAIQLTTTSGTYRIFNIY
ncbi:hypothetical protein F5050DRAFT_1582352, partial [Lentinula boryana]